MTRAHSIIEAVRVAIDCNSSDVLTDIHKMTLESKSLGKDIHIYRSPVPFHLRQISAVVLQMQPERTLDSVSGFWVAICFGEHPSMPTIWSSTVRASCAKRFANHHV